MVSGFTASDKIAFIGAIGGLIAAVAAIAACYIAWRQKRDSEEAGRQQALEAKRSVELAERSAVAAEASANTAKLALETTRRAWVLIEQVEILEHTSEGFPLQVHLFLTNTGHTPAQRLITMSLRRIGTCPPTEPDVSAKDNDSRGPLGNGQSITLVAQFPYSVQEIQMVRDRAVGLYLLGWAKYHDVLGQPHETRWSFKYDYTVGQFMPLDSGNSCA